VRISYRFPISDCRGDSVLGLRSCWHLAQECGSVLSRVFAAILSRSEHCAAAFSAQVAKTHIGIKLILLYRLILGTHIIFVLKNNFLPPSDYCPDTSKRIPLIVTATETKWRNRFVRDWTETKRAKNHENLLDLNFSELTQMTQRHLVHCFECLDFLSFFLWTFGEGPGDVHPVPWKMRLEMIVELQIESWMVRRFRSIAEIGNSKFLCISRYKFELRFWFNLNSSESPGANLNCDFGFAVDWNLPTIQDFDVHFDDHFDSHLLRNGL